MTKRKRQSRVFRRNALAAVIGQCLAAGLTGGAQAADIFVADGEVTTNDNGLCSIVEAINNANNDDQSGSADCVAGSGQDRILLPVNSTFTISTADASGRALPAITDELTIRGNTATITRGAGAANFGLLSVQAELRLETLTLSNGTVDADSGGCILVDGARLELRRTTITGCQASEQGGAIRVEGGYLEVGSQSTLSNNTATGLGGGVYGYQSTVRLSNSNVQGNSALGGGGIAVLGGSLRSYGTIQGNSAAQQGGGALVQDASFVRFSYGSVTSNYAYYGGGGIYLRGGTATLAGCRIENNRSQDDGGGIALAQANVSIQRCQFRSNSGSDGGGLDLNEATVTFTDSTISGNTAQGDGGGIYAVASTLTFTNADVNDNAAQFSGGGVYLQDGAITVTDSTVSDNAAQTSGGGIKVSSDAGPVNADIEGSTFAANVAGSDGGGLQILYDVTVSLRNSTFGNNAASQEGGGLFARESTLTAEHLTFSGNSAGTDGDNVWIDASGGNVALRNTLIGAGLNGGVADCVVDAGSLTENLNNLIEDGSCQDDSDGLIVEDPLLEALGPNGGTLTFALLDGSPAIDAADEGTCLADDQRGVSRTAATCDIGAFELTAPIIVDEISAGVGAVAISASDGLCSLPEAILNSNGGDQFSPAADECEPGVEGASDRIILPQGATFTLTTPDLIDNRNGLPEIESRTTIQGSGATVRRESSFEFRLIENQGELSIHGLTLSGGLLGDYGRGGAISSRGNLYLNEVTLTGNSVAGNGGGLYAGGYRNETLSITNSTISNNTANSGGGIFARSDASLTNSTVSGNAAVPNSGYAPAPGGDANFAAAGPEDGEAIPGGFGYYLRGYGGGLATGYAGTLAITNSTIAFNTADSAGGLSVSNQLDMRNTVIADSDLTTPTDCVLRQPPPNSYYGSQNRGGELVGNVNNLVEDGSCMPTFNGNGQQLLSPLADNGGPTLTHALVTADNPAIDGGDAVTCAGITYDQRGAPFSRSVDGDGDNDAVCDIGAFESDGGPGDLIFEDGFE